VSDQPTTPPRRPPTTPEDPAAFTAPSREAIQRGLVATLLFALVVSVAITLYADVGDVGAALRHFDERWLLAATPLALAAHAVRGLRWHYYLALVSEPGELPPPLRSAAIYAAGVAMQVTPGRVGEWVKSYYVQRDGGASAARTAPIVLAERVTDILGLVLLAASGLFVYRTAFPVVAASALLAFGLLAMLRSPALARWVSGVIEHIPLIRRLAPHAEEFAGASDVLLTWRPLLLASAIAFASWVAEALAYWCILRGLGVDATSTTLFQAAFVWPVATLAGGLLLTPGGLGVAEGGLVALANTLVEGVTRGTATAAALVTRAATLWLPTAIGLLAIAYLARTAPVDDNDPG
jgi:uncharacterized protein (TIRG00374 family)